MDAEITVQDVEEVETRTGKVRWIVRDEGGREYTTFRPRIGEQAARFQGRRARIQYHETERNGFQNVYLDAIDAAPEPAPEAAASGAAGSDTDPDESAWNTAIEAAPWVLGTSEPEQEIPPEELYEKLEPFKRLVAEDIRHGGEHDES
jgi:hypothetical protein